MHLKFINPRLKNFKVLLKIVSKEFRRNSIKGKMRLYKLNLFCTKICMKHVLIIFYAK